ncbi:MAG: SDR family oxidoreductase [Patescibacteria group bacterium]
MANILVTGADGGIGSAICTLLRDAGHHVVKVTRTDADLASAHAIKTLKEHIATTQEFDWVICAQGFIDTETVLEKQTPDTIAATFNINTLATIYLAQQFVPHLARGGGMIAISSAAGIQANGRFSVYSASKAAVNSFMQAMARNRPEQNFFAVCPGPTNTTMRERIAHDAKEMQSPKVIAEVVATLINHASSYKSGDLILVKDGSATLAGRL